MKTKAVLRLLAAATLSLWFTAQVLCTLHCISWRSGTDSVGSRACCRKAESQSPKSSSQSGTMPSGACFAFKAMASQTQAVVFFQAPLREIDQPPPAIVALSQNHFKVVVPRHHREIPKCVLTHEVSLGAFACALAPPVVS